MRPSPADYLRERVAIIAKNNAIEGAGFSFTGDDIRLLCKPCVYLLLKEGKPLYIGMSQSGASRLTASNHKQAAKARKECDQAMIYPCKNVMAANRLEKTLIFAMRPVYNRRGVVIGRREIMAYNPFPLHIAP